MEDRGFASRAMDYCEYGDPLRHGDARQNDRPGHQAEGQSDVGQANGHAVKTSAMVGPIRVQKVVAKGFLEYQ